MPNETTGIRGAIHGFLFGFVGGVFLLVCVGLAVNLISVATGEPTPPVTDTRALIEAVLVIAALSGVACAAIGAA